MARFFFSILLFVGLMFVLDLSQAEKTNDGEMVFWPSAPANVITDARRLRTRSHANFSATTAV
ncbi:hypothetical protein QJS10_CPA10g01539 [Acorus calamus]|uniref:Uncharacterized protein n=1 Tax=Acorus calamus TaxID=4465 RepID=A0AAV9DYZ7_ACOCL|nr:hypothetical protein QJS10_CPA10g01539 [Acorus calamus]